MKKRVFFILFALFIVVVGYYIYDMTRFKATDIVLEFKDVGILEYGDTFDVSDLILSCSGEIVDQEAPDMKKVGKQVLKFVVKEEGVSREFEYEVEVKDTKAPVIVLKKEKDTIELGSSYHISQYIQSVKDEVDGDLEYKKQADIKAGDFQYYTYESQVNVHKEGTYKVKIIAIDNHGLKSEKEMSIVVKKTQSTAANQNSASQNSSSQSQNSTTQQYTVNPNHKVIVIDPGHQGKGNSEKEAVGPGASTMKAKVSSGGTGVYSKKTESQINLEVGLKLKTELEARGYTVVMTRTSQNVNISNQQRANIGNSHNASAVIHLHCDGGAASARGAHTIAPSKNNPYCPQIYNASSMLAQNVINAYCKATGIKSRGISYRDDLTGINWSKVPSIYLEMGFLSNAEEDKLLSDSRFQLKCVQGIANGLDQYFR